MKKIVPLFLVPAFFLSACTNMSDRDKTKAQGAGAGALLGAIAGGIIGHQSGKGLEGAAIGAVIGTMAGGVYGSHVAGKKAQFAKQEDYLNAMIGESYKVYQETAQVNANLQNDINQLSTQVDQLVALRQQRQASNQQLAQMRGALQQKITQANEQLALVNNELRIQREVLANESKNASGQQQLAQMQQNINALETQKAQLTQHTQTLAAVHQRIAS